MITELINNENFQAIILNPQVIAFFLAVVLEIFRRVITPKAYVIWGTGHGFNFTIPQNPQAQHAQAIPNMPVNTRSVFVRNNGRGPAKNIEFYFNYKPEHYEIWPVVQHTTENAPDGRFIIKIPFIAKKESFGIETIHSVSNAPEVLNVRAEQGKCKEVKIAPMRIFNTWVNNLILMFLLLGVFQLLTFLVKIILLFLGNK